jgi:hypothetical protein
MSDAHWVCTVTLCVLTGKTQAFEEAQRRVQLQQDACRMPAVKANKPNTAAHAAGPDAMKLGLGILRIASASQLTPGPGSIPTLKFAASIVKAPLSLLPPHTHTHPLSAAPCVAG